MGKPVLDLRLYAILDPEVSGGHDLADLARRLAAGGTTLVQLRDKQSETRVMVERARAIKAALGTVPLLINDRVDVALAAGADGVHIGWEDMAPADARRLLGRDAIIGLTINSPQRADATDLSLIEYAGIGGVFGFWPDINQCQRIFPDQININVADIERRRDGKRNNKHF